MVRRIFAILLKPIRNSQRSICSPGTTECAYQSVAICFRALRMAPGCAAGDHFGVSTGMDDPLTLGWPRFGTRMERRAITIEGVVQGVGFRPYVYGLAARFALAGFVKNRSGGVLIE